MKRKIKYIFVHCTASRQTWSVDALLKEFSNKGWHYPGYHHVVEANGKVDIWERIKECPCFDAIPEYADIK